MRSLINCALLLGAGVLAQTVTNSSASNPFSTLDFGALLREAGELARTMTGSASNPLKTLDYGTFKGFYDPRTNTDNWLGMPFANYGRLQNPTLISSANKLQGVQDATNYGPACLQTELITSTAYELNAEVGKILSFVRQMVFPKFSNQAEDCLSINVQVPHGLNSTAKLPVLLWIHGGGWEVGASTAVGSEMTAVQGVMYQGANIVHRSIMMNQPIVFVSANYRLNVFGWLASQEITDAGLGNLGLKDQRIAMQWVQKYIHEFGGDPTKVTLFGESAGSISIATHMVLNNGSTDGLYRGAVMMSGGPHIWDSYQRGQRTFDAVMKSVGCDTTADKIACFRAAPYDAIYKAVQEQLNFFGYASTNLPWYPRPDGTFMPASPETLLAQGMAANIPYIIGDTVDEGTIFSLINQLSVKTNDDFMNYIPTNFFPNGNRSVVEALCKLYSEDPAEGSPFNTGKLYQLGPQYKRLAAIIGDFMFQAPRRNLLAHTSDRQNAWSYQFQASIPLLGNIPGLPSVMGMPILGSFHITDVAFHAFGNIPPTLSKNTLNLMSILISFVNTLDPNTHGLDLPYWPRYNSTSKTLFRFKEDGPDLVPDTYRDEQMAFINAHPNDFRL